MKVLSYFLLMAAFFVNCATLHSEPLKSREQILYYDRNGDGKVDFEEHHYPGTADADWILLDDDCDEKYEKKIHFGLAVLDSNVDIRVPTGVKIEETLGRWQLSFKQGGKCK
jgi:hypothetical protein